MSNVIRSSQLFCLAAAVLIVAACGGQKSNSTTTASTSGNATQTQASPGRTQPMMGGAAATVPPDMTCGATQPVWVNTRTHVYHMAGDPVYGRTKVGKYMCPSAAQAEGDRPAGGQSTGSHMRHHKGSTSY